MEPTENHWHPQKLEATRYDEKAQSTLAEEMETTENHWQPLAPTGTHWYTSTIGTHWNPLEPAGIHCTHFNPPKLEAPRYDEKAQSTSYGQFVTSWHLDHSSKQADKQTNAAR